MSLLSITVICFIYVYRLECFILVELRSLGIKTIWEFTHKWVLAPKYARSNASKALKVFICVYVLYTNGLMV